MTEQSPVPESVPTKPKVQRAIFSKRKKAKPLPADQLTAIWNAEITSWTAKGWTVEGTTTLFGRKALLREPWWRAFLRDLLLVLVTAGVWLIYMMYRKLLNKTTLKLITVDRFGRVRTSRWTDQIAGE